MKEFRHLIVTLAIVLAGALLVSGQVTIPYTFSPSTTIRSSEVNSNFSALSSGALNRAGGTLTGAITSSGGSFSGTFSGAPTFSGAVTFSGSPTFSGNPTFTAGIANTGLRVLGATGSNYVQVTPGTTYTANRTLTLTTGDADRTVTLSGNPTLADWFDQGVKTTSNVTHANGIFSGTLAVTGKPTLSNSAINLRGVDYTLPSADGSTNQVLKTNGSGVLSFGNAGTGYTFLGYSSTVTSSLTIKSGGDINTAIDLNAHAYYLVIHSTTPAQVTVNNDTTATRYQYATPRIDTSGVASNVTSGSAANWTWAPAAGGQGPQFVNVTMRGRSNTVVGAWTSTTLTSGAPTAGSGGGSYAGVANGTEIDIATTAGSTLSVWIYQLAES
jgi:hypothetical protein